MLTNREVFEARKLKSVPIKRNLRLPSERSERENLKEVGFDGKSLDGTGKPAPKTKTGRIVGGGNIDSGTHGLKAKRRSAKSFFGYDNREIWKKFIAKFINYDPYSVKFTHSPLMNEIHRKKLENDPDLDYAIKMNVTNVFLEDLLWRMDNTKNFIIVIYGATGIGKSTIAQFIGRFITDYCNMVYRKKMMEEFGRAAVFDSSNICFSRTELLKRVQNAMRYETVVFDEDDKSLLHLGGFREQDEMDKLEKTIRGLQLNFIFCSPVLEEHTAHYTIKAFDINLEQKLNRSIVYIKDDEIWSGMSIPEGHIITPHYEVEGYREKKTVFINNVKNRTLRDRYEEYDDIAREMMDKFRDLCDGKHNKILKSVIRREHPRFISEEYDDIIASITMINAQSKMQRNRTMAEFGGS